MDDAAEVRIRIEHMAKIARVLRVVFGIVFWLLIVSALAFFALSMASNMESGTSMLKKLIAMIPFIASATIGCVLPYIATRIFDDISKRQSPFTNLQSKRITMLGVLLLVYAVFEALVSVNPLHIEFGEIGIDYISSPGVFVDAKLIIAAIVCFCLSYVFRYGALLQWFSDESL